LIYQNRSEAQTIFADELNQLQKSLNGRFRITHLLSNPSTHHQPAARLNNTLLEQLLEKIKVNLQLSRFYLCGPPAFMRMCQFVLHVMKVPDQQIHKEIFYFESAPVARLSHSRETRNVLLSWNQHQYRFPVQYPDSILTAALKSGIKLPYSCRGGRCSTCTIKCNSGKVVMSINETLTERDLQAGLVLTCVGYPESDIELEYPF
jgi:ring-1,2-phenylacetyl-CoA epoxidase subunit PaaE